MLTAVIQRYTREAGVRNLKREICKLMRKAVAEIVKTKVKSIVIDEENADQISRRRHLQARRDRSRSRRLAW